jgi:enamine deaminase RidA (YjgF/YER057c/UK114 family)
MTSNQILHPAHWKKAAGYANGILAEGRTVWIGGQIGWNRDQIFEVHDLVGQTHQTLSNIVAILAEAGGRPEHVVRMTWYVKDKKDYLANLKGIGEVYRAVMGRHFPAMTMVQVADLIEDEAVVEIEATAVLPA